MWQCAVVIALPPSEAAAVGCEGASRNDCQVDGAVVCEQRSARLRDAESPGVCRRTRSVEVQFEFVTDNSREYKLLVVGKQCTEIDFVPEGIVEQDAMGIDVCLIAAYPFNNGFAPFWKISICVM